MTTENHITHLPLHIFTKYPDSDDKQTEFFTEGRADDLEAVLSARGDCANEKSRVITLGLDGSNWEGTAVEWLANRETARHAAKVREAADLLLHLLKIYVAIPSGTDNDQAWCMLHNAALTGLAVRFSLSENEIRETAWDLLDPIYETDRTERAIAEVNGIPYPAEKGRFSAAEASMYHAMTEAERAREEHQAVIETELGL